MKNLLGKHVQFRLRLIWPRDTYKIIIIHNLQQCQTDTKVDFSVADISQNINDELNNAYMCPCDATWLCQKIKVLRFKIRRNKIWDTLYDEQRGYSRNVSRALTYPLMDVRLSIISGGMDITTDIAANFSLVLPHSGRANTRDAFLGGGFNYTSHAHTRPFGPAALLGQRWRPRRRRTRRACPKKAGRTLCALLGVYSMRVGVYLIIIL